MKKKDSTKKSKSKSSGVKSNKKDTKASSASFGVDVLTADQLTVIHLLASYDLEVVRKAIESIYSYCNINPAILLSFCERGIWTNLEKLLTLKDNDILEMSLSLIRNILNLTSFQLIMLDEAKTVFTKFINIYLNFENPDLLTVCSEVMIKLLDIHKEIIPYVFEKLLLNRTLAIVKNKPGDEVKSNAMRLMSAFIDEREHSRVLVDLPNFQSNLYVCFVKDNNILLQKPAMDFLIKISSFKDPELLRSLFNNNVPHLLIDLLAEEKFINIYFDVIYLNSLILDNFQNCLEFVESVQFPLLLSFVKHSDETFELRYVQLLSIFSKFPDKEYRQKLHTYGFESVILILFETKSEEVLQEICKIFINLSDHTYGLEYLLQEWVLDRLIALLESKTLSLVEAVIYVIHCFLKKNENAFDLFYERRGVSVLIEIFMNSEEILEPLIYEKVMDVLQIYLTHPKYRENLIERSLFIKVIRIYESSSVNCALKASYILNNSFLDRDCRNAFLELNGFNILLEKLDDSTDKQLFKNTLMIIKTLVVYKRMSQVFLMNGLIPALKKYEDDFICATLILKMICELFLPLKFHKYNRLEVTDSIRDNFYLINGSWNEQFPLLEDLELQRKSTRVTIYYVDYSYTKAIKNRLKAFENRNIGEGSINSFEAPKNKTVVANVNFGGLTEDPYLYDYFVELEEMMSEDDYSMEDKVKLIATYVADQMSGFPVPNLGEPKHIFKIHLDHLKQRLGTNMIPIGFLRMGYSCERALLFKVLADRFNIYNAFSRNARYYWNEVALVSDIAKKVVYCVVDLFRNIGEMYVINERDAIDYYDYLDNLWH